MSQLKEMSQEGCAGNVGDRIRVIQLIYQAYLPNQGRYPRVSDQAQILQRAGCDVTVLACDRDCRHPEQETLEGIEVRRIRVKTRENRGPVGQFLPLLLFAGRVLRWFEEHAVDALVCHNLDVLPLGLLVRRKTGCKLIFDAHEPNYYALWPRPLAFMVALIERLDVALARRCDAVSVTNGYQIKKYGDAGVRRIALVGNYTRPALRIDDLDEDKFKSDVTVFGRLGTFYRDVGLEPTLRAFARLHEKVPSARLMLGGRVVDTYRAAFEREVSEAEVGPVLDCVGSYDAARIPDLYRKIHVSCLVYPRNAWFRNITPTKFFDSISNGVPVIMTDIGGLGDIITEHRCGIVVDENDIDAICDAMLRLAKDRELLIDMARNALKLRKSVFSWEAMRDAYVKLLQDVCGSSLGQVASGTPG